MLLAHLFESATILLMEGISHPEDMVFDKGSLSANQAVQMILHGVQNPEQISIKWDGFPALVFGWNPNGEFVLVDKHMFEKIRSGKMDFKTIQEYDMERGAARTDLWAQEKVLRKYLSMQVPKNQPGVYYWADLLYVGKPPVVDGQFVFQPNTVEYRVNVDSQVGEQIAQSQAGLAVHSYYPDLNADDQPLTGLNGLDPNGAVALFTGRMEQPPQIRMDNMVMKACLQVIKQQGAQLDEFLKDLRDQKLLSVIAAAKTFITHKIKIESESPTGALENMVPEFKDYLSTKLSPKALEKVNTYLSTPAGAQGVNAMWNVWLALTDLKLHVKAQIDQSQSSQGQAVQAFVDGKPSHEGYVTGSGTQKLKLIDRLVFSAANFKKDRSLLKEQAVGQGEKAVFTFARMNPPTKAHTQVVMGKLKELAGGQDYWIFLSHSTDDPERDPLTWDQKIKFLKQIAPEHAAHIVEEPSIKTPGLAFDWLYNQGYTHLVMVAGSDRFDGMKKFLQNWNSPEVTKKYNRQPITVEMELAGEERKKAEPKPKPTEPEKLPTKTDPDQSTLADKPVEPTKPDPTTPVPKDMSEISSTDARKAVKNNDLAEFEKTTGLKGTIAQQMFDAVAQGMRRPKIKK